MSKWQEKTKRPVLPVYMAALVWPIMALLVPISHAGRAGADRRGQRGRLLCGHKALPLPALCAPTCPMPQAVRTWTPC